MTKYYKPLALLCLLFLMVGSMFCMNDILLPSLIGYFKLNYKQATLIQLTFYSTYIIFPIPIACMIQKCGYKISLIVALLICSFGCAMFIPAKFYDSFPIILMALFVIATGLTVVNVAANPFITLLGDPKSAHRRMNFVQSFSRVGYTTIPLIATALIYGDKGEIRYHYPYLLLSVSIFIVALFFYFSRIPSMKAEKEEPFIINSIFKESTRYRHLFFGVFAMFFYLGTESCTCGLFIPYLKSVLGFTEVRAAKFLTLYYVFTVTIGFLAVIVLKYVKAYKLLGWFGICMIINYLICIFINTGYNEFLMAGQGIFISIMFATLFSLAIEDLGDFTGKGSALLNFAFVGGSVFPPIQGMIADKFGVAFSYMVPCICCLMVTVYAFTFTREALLKKTLAKNA